MPSPAAEPRQKTARICTLSREHGAPACGSGLFESARRARQVCRAFSHPAAAPPTSQKVSPVEGRVQGCDRPCCAGFRNAAPPPTLAGRSREQRVVVTDSPSAMLSALHAADADLVCRHAAERSPLPSPVCRLGIRPQPNPCREAVSAGNCRAHASLARTGPRPRPCMCRESWRGHGGAALRFACLGLHRRNRPARQISPLLRRFLARQISRACRSSAALRPSVRRARTRAVRITPRPRWARTWINLERTSS